MSDKIIQQHSLPVPSSWLIFLQLAAVFQLNKKNKSFSERTVLLFIIFNSDNDVRELFEVNLKIQLNFVNLISDI